VYGTGSTGKSAILQALLHDLAQSNPADEQPELLRYAIINSIQCVTARHLFEQTLGSVADALEWESPPRRCETQAQLTVELTKMLLGSKKHERWRFVLVFDSIDRQKEAPATLIPGLARLSEIVGVANAGSHLVLTPSPLTFPIIDSLPDMRFRRHDPPSGLSTSFLCAIRPVHKLRQA
jgi:hypothetical protein